MNTPRRPKRPPRRRHLHVAGTAAPIEDELKAAIDALAKTPAGPLIKLGMPSSTFTEKDLAIQVAFAEVVWSLIQRAHAHDRQLTAIGVMGFLDDQDETCRKAIFSASAHGRMVEDEKELIEAMVAVYGTLRDSLRLAGALPPDDEGTLH